MGLGVVGEVGTIAGGQPHGQNRAAYHSGGVHDARRSERRVICRWSVVRVDRMKLLQEVVQKFSKWLHLRHTESAVILGDDESRMPPPGSNRY